MSPPEIETIESNGQILAMVIRQSYLPSQTSFLTPKEFNQQVGFIVYSRGSTIRRHRHTMQERRIVGTTEVIWIKRGHCRLDVFDDREIAVKQIDLRTGDLVILVARGHGFEVEEDTVLVEVKQGPFSPTEDKVFF